MAQDEEEPNETAVFQAQHQNGSTLLPSSVANAVSLVTRSSSLYIRLGTFIGGLALDGARITTLTSLELSRAIIESVLIRSGRDVSSRSMGELGRAEAEGLLERSVAALHKTITGISFAASTGFQFSSVALNSATDMSQHLLGVLDSILGSTDSSRAIASIITLIRREFQNPATGREGEKVGVSDLIIGACGLALLQRWSKKLTDLECKEGKFEDVVWDVVILDNGRRADVVGNTGVNESKELERQPSMTFMSTAGNEVLETVERDSGNDSDLDDDLLEINLKQRIMRSLPADASVSITTSTTTTKTIIVEITGAYPPDLSPLPGVEVIEENALFLSATEADAEMVVNGQPDSFVVPKHRAVYQIVQNRLHGTNVASQPPPDDTAIVTEVEDTESKEASSPPSRGASSRGFSISSISSTGPEDAPEVPPKSPNTLRRVSADRKLVSAIPIPASMGNIANQKRSRKPINPSSSVSEPENSTIKNPIDLKSPPIKKAKIERPPSKLTEKKNSFKNTLKKGSNSALSNIWHKDQSNPEATSSSKTTTKPAWGATTVPATTKSNGPASLPLQNPIIVPAQNAPRQPQRDNPNYFSSRDLGQLQSTEIQRSPSRTSYYSIHEHRRDSLVSQTDTYSIHSAETRPGSPTAFRTQLKSQSNLLRARSEKNIVGSQLSTGINHKRAKSYVPSIYTLKTNNSETSLAPVARPRQSAFKDSGTLESLARTGYVDGLFPQHHLVRNITRFVRFASASYGANFLRVMGITPSNVASTEEIDTAHHHEHHSFSSHTQLPADTILLSSFVDLQGGADSTGMTNTGIPMIHFVSLDHESKSVVLTCRGTLGFEDVLTDMTCEYDILTWRGQDYSVHKGIHASARRLLNGSGSRALATIATSLEEFPDYGLVMCGHSLGGGVTALLAIMISEPSPDLSSTAFITSTLSYNSRPLLTDGSDEGTAPPAIHLPPGRPVHVYAYGPPATLSPSLRIATRGLITTLVNGQDLVPYLSLGVLHDLQAVALAFKTDDSGAKGEVRNRVWAGITGSFRDKWYAGSGEGAGAFGSGPDRSEDDQWAYSALKALRACMLSSKLLPPGEVFVVESCPILKRDAFVGKDGKPVEQNGGGDMGSGLGRPATRAVLKYIRDVEKRFSEVRFGGSMLLDHSPGRYEASLGALSRGVLGQDS